MIYFDATFFVRLYLEEDGFEEVRALANGVDVIHASILGKMEIEAAMHRHFREGKINARALNEAYSQFIDDQTCKLIEWLPLTPSVIDRVHDAFRALPATVFLRAGDAIHLATASGAGSGEIYSNDRRLLSAASFFELNGINPLAK